MMSKKRTRGGESMEWYQLIIVVVTVTPLVGGMVVYLVRKNDKLAESAPLAKKNSEQLREHESEIVEAKRQIKAIWGAIEKHEASVMELKNETIRGFSENAYANDLIFRAISGIAAHTGASEVVEMIDRETIRTTRRRVGNE